MIAVFAAWSALAQDAPPAEPAPTAAPAAAPAPVPEPVPAPEPTPAVEPAPAPAPVAAPEPPAAGNPWEGVTAPAATVAPETDDAVYMGVPKPISDPPKIEASIELGSLSNSDPSYDLFSDGDGMPSWGLKGGYRVRDRIAVIGSWHHVRRGAEVSIGSGTDSTTDGDFESDSNTFVAAMFGNEIAAGAKVDVSIADALLPYVSAQGLLFSTQLKFDDEPTSRQNPGQVSGGGTMVGFLATAGAELRIPPAAAVSAAWYLEMGYGWLSRAEVGDFGTMKPGGFAVRSGLGLRF